MLSIHSISSAKDALHYFSNADYYTKESGDAISSGWAGQGASSLGLSGEVQKAQFENLLKGTLPNGEQLGRIKNGRVEHHCGWDFTLSAPKSVSILALAGGDSRLLRAHEHAVKETLGWIEKNHLFTRQSHDGRIKNIKTNNLLVAQFTHTTSRALDPQLHTHNAIMNATLRADGVWRSIDSRPLYASSMLIGQIYRNFLAHRVLALGFEIQDDRLKGTFEIKGVPEAVIKLQSKRREEVEQAVKEFGYKGAKGYDKAAVRSRQSKQRISPEALFSKWDQELNDLQFDPQLLIARAKSNEHKAQDLLIPSKPALQKSIQHLAEREAVFTQEELIKTTILNHLGRIDLHQLQQEIQFETLEGNIIEKGLLKEYGEELAYSTREAGRKEKYILKLMQTGRSKVTSVLPKYLTDDELSSASQKIGKELNKGQLAAAKLILSTKDQVIGIQGFAGTGKSTLLKAVKVAADKKGYQMVGLSPTSSAAAGLEESSGITSKTLAKHLNDLAADKKKSPKHKDIWVVDEASLINANDMADLLTISRRTGARVVLVGDRHQLGAVEWGKPFAQMMRNGMQVSRLKEIRRQAPGTLIEKAVQSIIKNKMSYAEAFNTLGPVIFEDEQKGEEPTTQEERLEKLIKYYLELSKEERDDTLLMIPDNETRTSANRLIRTELQKSGELGHDKKEFVALDKESYTRAQKQDVREYKEGFIVQFGRDYERLGIKKGELYTVESKSIDKNLLHLKSEKGKIIDWDPAKIAGKSRGGVEIYNQAHKALAIGDLIRWSKNSQDLGIKNSDEGRVVAVRGNNVTIKWDNGTTSTLDFSRYKHWDYAYAKTVFAAQGATYERAIVLAESWRRNLINQKSFYVALTRAVKESVIFTDNAEKLQEAIADRPGEKTSSLETPSSQYQQILDADGLVKDTRMANINKEQERQHNFAKSL